MPIRTLHPYLINAAYRHIVADSVRLLVLTL